MPIDTLGSHINDQRLGLVRSSSAYSGRRHKFWFLTNCLKTLYLHPLC